MEFIYFLVAFVTVYLLYLFLVILNKRGLVKLKSGIESRFLTKVYKIDVSKIKDKKYANDIALNNSLIISATFSLTNLFFKNPIFQILLAFPIIVLLIIFLYAILGRRYKKYV